ncbi:MAG: ATP-grasp domain-containing protein [Clostridia bacterium]|nr:ATP-grasp domain-containing protein [Clostridia bacterium]
MKAIITDVKYRMSISLIRDLAEKGVEIIACHSGSGIPFAFSSKFVSETAVLPDSQAQPEEFLSALAELCRSHTSEEGLPVVLPVGAKTLGLLAGAEGRKAMNGVCRLCLPDSASLDLANDKARLAELAKQIGVPVPLEYDPFSDPSVFNYPVVIKPVCGEKQGLSAEQRYIIAHDPETAAKATSHFTFDGVPPVVQQYLSGSGLGYSVVAFEGEIVNAICHKRLREYPLSGGPSTCCQAIDGSFVRKYAEKLIKALNFTGLAMIEFKLDKDGNPYLLEINPRIWGTFPLTRASKSSLGYDWFCLAAGIEPIRVPPRNGTKMYYLLSDARRAAACLKKGRVGQALSSICSWVMPGCNEGIFEWKDAKASFAYLSSYIKRGVGQ